MNESTPDESLPSAAVTAPAATLPLAGAAAGHGLSLSRWLVEGLRAAVFLRPRVAGAAPRPGQLLLIVVLVFGADLGLGRLAVAGPANFHLQIWLGGWFWLLLFIALAWWTRRDEPQPAAPADRLSGVAACVALYLLAGLPSAVLYQSFSAALAQGWIKVRWIGSPWAAWGLAIAMLLWSLATSVVLLGRFGGWRWRVAASALLLVGVAVLTISQSEGNAWSRDYAQDADAETPRLQLSQQAFEAQQRLLPAQLAGLAPRRPGVSNVYGLVFAPYASEDVFLRESTMVGQLLAERFDAQGRVIHLMNHASTTDSLAWATPQNLRRAIDGIAAHMDREHDLLVVYMTSHGASNFKLAAEHWPLEVDWLTPEALREALDQAGIRHRVIAISACYSGGWIEPLANADSLVMTAADATHTSFGCGRLSELTFFGRAMFDEQLRSTRSFEQAFARAVPLIKQREIDAGKDDGFSNPQIKVGANIVPVLRELERRLEAAPAPLPAASEPAKTPR